jgi:3-deoxy-D-manno-octulosonic-acid transferase
MMFSMLSILSYFLLTPLRWSCGILAKLMRSEKAKIFLQEREKSHFETIITQAKAALRAKQNEKNPLVYWLHVSSAGELEQVIPILRTLHEKHSVLFFLTYFSPSAKAFTQNCPGLLATTSLPLEDPRLFRKIISELKVSRLLLVRYDFWPMMLSVAEVTKTPVGILAATLERARSPLPQKLQLRIRTLWFQRSDLIFLVSENDKFKLLELKFPEEKIVVSGDAKWARAKERAENAVENKPASKIAELKKAIELTSLVHPRKIMVFGSPHEEELSILEQCIGDFVKDEISIVAPAEVDEKSISIIQTRLTRAGASTFRLSQETRESLSAALCAKKARVVLILDSFGHLAEAYRCADIAIVGGGFDGQLHNVLEPVAHPVLTLYGNNAKRAPEAHRLLEHKAALGFANPKELFQFLAHWSTLKESDGESLEVKQKLAETLKNARDLFSSLPDTSEVVCRALAKQDSLEST